MLLALFLVDLAAGMLFFLPLVGRRNAGPKFYRLVLIVAAALMLVAAFAHFRARRLDLARFDAGAVVVTALMLSVLRYPKRVVYRVAAAAVALAYGGAALDAYHSAVLSPSIVWSVIGATASAAILGSVMLAMTLGHWYLVVRGMPIEPLKKLSIALLAASIARVAVVLAAFAWGGSAVVHEIVVREGFFFWMRAGWGLLCPLLLFPMVWGTVKIRSTMAATGILYVDVVAVVIGEVLGGWLSAIAHLPV